MRFTISPPSAQNIKSIIESTLFEKTPCLSTKVEGGNEFYAILNFCGFFQILVVMLDFLYYYIRIDVSVEIFCKSSSLF